MINLDENNNTDNNPEESVNENKKGMNPVLMISAVVGLLIVAGGFLFLSAKNSQVPSEEAIMDVNQSTVGEGEEQEMATEEPDVEINIKGGMYYFDQKEITVKEGDRVRIILTSQEGRHDFVIDKFNVISSVVDEGESTTVEFVADQAGEYEYYCSVMDHRQRGMVGTLVVE